MHAEQGHPKLSPAWRPIGAIGDERQGEGGGMMETCGKGLADPFVKLNGKENAAHTP